MNKVRTWFVVLAALAIVAAACGSDDTTSGSTDGAIEPSKTFTKIGEPEGALELIAWAGYVEDGTSEGGEDFDWVTPFEDATGCQVNVTYGDTSDEMVTLMRQGGGTVYDGVSASGDASNRRRACECLARRLRSWVCSSQSRRSARVQVRRGSSARSTRAICGRVTSG